MNQKFQKTIKSNDSTKAEKIIAMLQRDTGVTIAGLTKVTGWQRNSVHGFVSGTLKNKHGLISTSSKEANKDRRYRIVGDA